MRYKFLLIIYLFIPFEVFSLEDEIFDINILVYNTHGLPEIFIDDNPKSAFPLSGKKHEILIFLYYRKIIHIMKNYLLD